MIFLSLLRTAFAADNPGQALQIAQVASVDPLPLDIIQSANASHLSLPPTVASSLLNTSTLQEEYDYTCDGPKYGGFSKPDDCLSALGRFVQGQDRVVFAERESPERVESVHPLPWRWMGG